MYTNITKRISINHIDMDLYKEWQELQKARNNLKARMIDKLKEKSDWATILLKDNWPSSTSGPAIEMTDNEFKVTVRVDVDKESSPILSYVSESTLNVLLTGKLLTDEEKRAVIKHHFGDILNGLESEESPLE